MYESLCAQTFRDFEWVIVDDGSTDRSRELVSSWKAFFPIRYTWKENGGKHTAVNLGVRQARGEFTLIFDSDDRCVSHALERFDFRWRQLSEPDRYATMASLSYGDDGLTILGKLYPREWVDAFNLRDALALIGDDERWSIIRTDVLRKFPYPEFRNERNVAEGLVWNRILGSYASRYFNEPLRIYMRTPGSLSQSGDLRWANPRGAVVYHSELALSHDLPIALRLKALLNVARFGPLAAFRWAVSTKSKP